MRLTQKSERDCQRLDKKRPCVHTIYLIDQIVVHVLPAVLGARHAAVAVKHTEKAALDAVRHVGVPIERRVGDDLCNNNKKQWDG